MESIDSFKTERGSYVIYSDERIHDMYINEKVLDQYEIREVRQRNPSWGIVIGLGTVLFGLIFIGQCLTVLYPTALGFDFFIGAVIGTIIGFVLSRHELLKYLDRISYDVRLEHLNSISQEERLAYYSNYGLDHAIPSDIIRSEFEREIERYIRRNFPHLKIETNNRNIIPSRDSTGQYLEIDIWLPELQLGIEANGAYWHDREKYEKDLRNGTKYSDEMYKENYCKAQGITLIHVWDSDRMETIQKRIDSEINARR